MPQGNIMLRALAHAVLTALYVGTVAFFMSHAETLLGKTPNKALGTAGFLLLFVVSAAVTSSMVFGKPLLWYLDGKKHEAVRLALFTILFLALIMIAILLSLALRNTGTA